MFFFFFFFFFFAVMILFFFFPVDVTVFFSRLITCCEKRKNAIDYVNVIHAIVCDEISHRMLEKRSTNPNRTFNLF